MLLLPSAAPLLRLQPSSYLATSSTWLIVGLGNPGHGYSRNRHNVGQMVVDELAARVGGKFRTHKAHARVLEGRLGPGGARVVIAKPLTYMNLSGGPTSSLAKFFSIPADHVLAIHDEVDIPFGALKVKLGGGEGGHNGLRDISKALGSKNYYRLRFGVGRPPGRMDTAEHVLKDFSTVERPELPFLLDAAAAAAETLIADGLLAAQQKYHAPKA